MWRGNRVACLMTWGKDKTVEINTFHPVCRVDSYYYLLWTRGDAGLLQTSIAAFEKHWREMSLKIRYGNNGQPSAVRESCPLKLNILSRERPAPDDNYSIQSAFACVWTRISWICFAVHSPFTSAQRTQVSFRLFDSPDKISDPRCSYESFVRQTNN